MKTKIFICLLAAGAFAFWWGAVRAQGSLTPPGPPGPTFKTLQQLEPRTPISSLPYTITQSGSYYVTANLTPARDENGIVVAANDVTIDLAGFTLSGGGGSSGEGISASGARANIVIRDGTVRGWRGSGVNFYDSASSGVSVQNIHSVGNSFTGIGLRDNSQATDCVAEGNFSYGILVGTVNNGNGISAPAGGTIRGCTARGNAGIGISVGTASTIIGCAAVANSTAGFVVGDGSTVAECTSNSNPNSGDGFNLGNGVTAKDCTAAGNGGVGINAADGCTLKDCTAQFNSSRGIVVGNGCTIANCTVSSNATYGIYAESGGAIRGCTVRDNSGANGNGIGIRVNSFATVADCTVSGNAGDGIQFIHNCQILNNLANGNGVDGIHCFGFRNRIDNNQAHVNTGYGINIDASSTTGVITRNSANGNATNYNRVSHASIGPLGDPSTATSPWANFSY